MTDSSWRKFGAGFVVFVLGTWVWLSGVLEPRVKRTPAVISSTTSAPPRPLTPSELAEQGAARPEPAAQPVSVEPKPSEAKRRWYQGGTLHRASAAEWKAGSYEDKLATAGDLLAKLWLEKRLAPKVSSGIGSVDDLAPLAAQLVVGLDKAFSGPPETTRGVDVPTATVLLLTMMGWT